MKINLYNFSSLLLAASVLFLASCERNKEVLSEPPKEITGTWRISKVLRNSNDISQWVDIENFRLTLQEDKTYTLEGNNIPFVISDVNGNWSVDDPLYPYKLSFSSAGGDVVVADIGTTVIKGRRSLNVNFSPGCRTNQYSYVFERVN